ncbi:hypothetical protein D5S17_31390 [Pseudonocardiaceae bacterium YIM PH 21723]|nr:hypothetical protein D5S17_31390 [Pseudonocardiaceae bacterium YIM PH 21723]
MHANARIDVDRNLGLLSLILEDAETGEILDCRLLNSDEAKAFHRKLQWAAQRLEAGDHNVHINLADVLDH